MEIRDLVQANRRRLWILVALPLLAGALAFIILDSRPRQYQAELTVTVPAGNETVGTNAQYVANFRQVLRSSQLAEAVARETGATEAGVADQLTSSQIAGSNRIRMRMNSPRPVEPSRVVETAARLATEQLEGPERQTAETRVATAQAAVSAAEATYNEKRVARDKLIASSDQVLPPETYQTKSARLGQLEDELQQAMLEGPSPDPVQAAADEKRRDALQAVVDQRRKELTALGEVVKQFQSLTVDLDRAEAALTVAQADLREVTRERRREPASVGKPQEAVVDRLAQMARGVGTAAALALLFALGIFLYPELRKAFRPAPPQPYPEPYPQPTRIYLPTGLEPARGMAIASLPPAPASRAKARHASTDAASGPADLWLPPGMQARTTVGKSPSEPDERAADGGPEDERTADEGVAGHGPGVEPSEDESPGDEGPGDESVPAASEGRSRQVQGEW